MTGLQVWFCRYVCDDLIWQTKDDHFGTSQARVEEVAICCIMHVRMVSSLGTVNDNDNMNLPTSYNSSSCSSSSSSSASSSSLSVTCSDEFVSLPAGTGSPISVTLPRKLASSSCMSSIALLICWTLAIDFKAVWQVLTYMLLPSLNSSRGLAEQCYVCAYPPFTTMECLDVFLKTLSASIRSRSLHSSQPHLQRHPLNVPIMRLWNLIQDSVCIAGILDMFRTITLHLKLYSSVKFVYYHFSAVQLTYNLTCSLKTLIISLVSHPFS